MRFPDEYALWLDRAPHGYESGETYAELAARVVPALRSLADRHPTETLLVVTHGGPSRVAAGTRRRSRLPRGAAPRNRPGQLRGVPFRGRGRRLPAAEGWSLGWRTTRASTRASKSRSRSSAATTRTACSQAYCSVDGGGLHRAERAHPDPPPEHRVAALHQPLRRAGAQTGRRVASPEDERDDQKRRGGPLRRFSESRQDLGPARSASCALLGGLGWAPRRVPAGVDLRLLRPPGRGDRLVARRARQPSRGWSAWKAAESEAAPAVRSSARAPRTARGNRRCRGST